MLTMWTLGVDVDLCLWESEPSEEGLEVLNVKAWGVEYLCWELGDKQKEKSMVDTQASGMESLSTTCFINILGANPTYTIAFNRSIPFFRQSKYAPFKFFLLLRCLCMHIFKKEIIYVFSIHIQRNDTSINHVYRILQNFRPSQHYPLQLS